MFIQLCEYGCGQEAKHQFKNGKWCCKNNTSSCPNMKKINSDKNMGKYISFDTKKKLSEANTGKKFSKDHIKKLSISHKGKKLSNEHKRKISISNKGKVFSDKHRFKIRIKSLDSISDKKRKSPLFSKIEEMRYNPDKPGEKEIQVHCKNHKCPNSKEQGGWFTPTKTQLYERNRGIEILQNDGCYFYCSDKCKNDCPLYALRSDPYKSIEKPYTSEEYQTFREFVLKRDDYKCQYCGKKADYVHHERPQKLEPFFTLDPDLAWSVCKKCHYKYGHKDECSTGKLANIICNKGELPL
ncbi:MAG: hypothetical protein DRN27_10350 [Thermoplasmata archaeon]|nr:MAG: hypothetical protein DRN27_10350 [Thermoplasmata archaeon]